MFFEKQLPENIIRQKTQTIYSGMGTSIYIEESSIGWNDGTQYRTPLFW